MSNTGGMCKFYLRGKCKFGDRCRDSHGSRNSVIAPHAQRTSRRSEPIGGRYYSVPLPKDIPVGVVAGKGRSNLRRIEEGLLPRIVHLLASEHEIKVHLEVPDEELFREVKGKLEHLSDSLCLKWRKGNVLNVIRLVLPDGVGTRNDLSLRFVRYEGSLSNHFHTNPHCKEGVHVLHCIDKTHHLNEDGHGTVAEEQPTSSLILNCGEVTSILHRGLKGMREELKQNGNLRGKLEARFGKKFWYLLPKETLDSEMSIRELGDLIDNKLKAQFRSGMNTSIDPTKVEALATELKSHCSEKHVLEIYYFAITLPAGDQRKQVDVRVVAMEDGTLKIIRVKKNERREAAIDVVCMHRQHDFRLELDLHEVVSECDPEFSSVNRLVETISVPRPGTLSFCPCIDEWKVTLLRYKRQSTFVLEDTFLVTISDVKECKVDWENYGRENHGELLTVNLEDFHDRHWELELNSILWECAFAKDVGHTPEKALSLYMEHPTVDAAVLAMVPHPWEPESLVSQPDIENVLQKVDWLSEQLQSSY